MTRLFSVAALTLLLHSDVFPQLGETDIAHKDWNPKLSSDLARLGELKGSQSAKILAATDLPKTTDGRLKVIVVPKAELSSTIPVEQIEQAGGGDSGAVNPFDARSHFA